MPPGVANQSPRRRETAGEQASPGRLAAFLDEHRAGLGAILVAIAAVGLGWAGWSRLGDRVRGAADLMLHPDSITVEGIAPWVRADLKSEALRDASLDPHGKGANQQRGRVDQHPRGKCVDACEHDGAGGALRRGEEESHGGWAVWGGGEGSGRPFRQHLYFWSSHWPFCDSK